MRRKIVHVASWIDHVQLFWGRKILSFESGGKKTLHDLGSTGCPLMVPFAFLGFKGNI